MDEIKIPKERVAVLIGKKGKTKKEIAQATHTKIKVDSNEGDIIIEGENGLDVYNAKMVIQAIGRGFNPEKALELLNEDEAFEMINIQDYARNTKNDLHRIKARIIGRNGKAKQIIQDLANVNLSIYGKTVCIIGKAENVDVARHAINNLLAGSRHGKVYSYLEKQRKIKHLNE